MAMPHRVTTVLAVAAFVTVVLPSLLSHGLCGHFRQRYTGERAQKKIAGITAHNSRKGVAAYWSFDSGEDLSPWRGTGIGTVPVRGAHRDGLRFNGHDDTFFATGFTWHPPSCFSLSFWVKLNPLPARQDIIFQGSPRPIGFRLDNGEIIFEVPTVGEGASVSFPFDKFNEFTHIAAVVDSRSHVISLYQDGELKAEGSFHNHKIAPWLVDFGRCSRDGKHNAFAGVLDEVALWDRGLDARTVRRLARRRSATRRMTVNISRRFRMANLRLMSAIADLLDRLAGLVEFDLAREIRARRGRASLRHVTLVAGNGALRHLYRAHARSIAAGHRTANASRPVRAYAVIGGKPTECMVSLNGGTLCYPSRARPAFHIQFDDDGDNDGVRSIILAPPESSGWLSRLADSTAWVIANLPSPPPQAELVTLGINGHAIGVYIMCDASKMLVQPGEHQNPLDYRAIDQIDFQREAEHERLAPDAPSPRTMSVIKAMLSDDEFRHYSDSLRNAADIIACDHRSPIAASTRIKDVAESLGAAIRRDAAPVSAASFPLDEFLVLGRDMSPDLIHNDLNLSAIRPSNGCMVTFRSNSPWWIDDFGRLLRRPDKRPEFVSLSATVRDETGQMSERTLNFRIAPKKETIPALFLWSPVPFGKTHRTDATVLFYEWRGQNIPKFFTATAAGGPGGVRYRGNSSFASEKKLLNIKLDSPHHLLSNTETSSLLAINSYSDQLKIWNSLAYTLFRSFPVEGGGRRVAPHVRPFEFFVNGRYCGLLEFAERLDNLLLGDADAQVFRHMTTPPREPFVRQTHPSPAEADAMPFYDRLVKMLETPPDKDSACTVCSMLDLSNAIDYQILFSLMANPNGRPYNYWTQDAIAHFPSTGKFLFIPWDFDDSSKHGFIGIVSTNLDRWLVANVPDYRKMRQTRWRELRNSVLSESAILALFDSILDVHFEYLPSNERRWPDFTEEDIDFARLRDEYRSFLSAQLGALDKEFAK